MTLKRNIIANYASQIYVVVIGIVMVPIYVRYMGAESYGLVGFFTLLQALMQLVDLGLSATLARQVASYRAGGLTDARLNALIRAAAGFFIAAGFVVAIGVVSSSPLIAGSWLQANSLPTSTVAQCVALMGIAAALRWIAGLYRGIVAGWEKQIWLGWYTVSIATTRFALVVPLFIFIGVDPRVFFVYQLLVAILELIVLWWKAGTLLPGAWARPSLAVEPLRDMWRFSGALAFSSLVWIFVTQTDKLVLSSTLALDDYAYFVMAMMLASGVSLLANPISGALLPRLTYLATRGDIGQFHGVYRNATQWVSVAVWPVAGTLSFFAEPLIFWWTRDAEIAQTAGPILFWYALGNALLGVAAFQYYMQFAHGKLTLHLIGNAVFVLTLIPGVIWASLNYGAVGAGRMWFGENLLFLLVWTWIVHDQFAPGLHWRWITQDVLPIAASTLIVSWALSRGFEWSTAGQLALFVKLIAVGTVAAVAAGFASSYMRARVALALRRFFALRNISG